MKIHFLLLCALCAARLSCAQDSLQVTFSEEKDTLTKQHFVDRYENVFMTKVPTRHMFKLDISRSELTGRGIYGGYEFKLLPALSLEAGLYGQTSRYYGYLFRDVFSSAWKSMSFWTQVRARYYYNMDKRIRSGASANNFSGAYAGLNYEQALSIGNLYGRSGRNMGRVGLLFGYQGRLFNRGHFDFNVGLFNKEFGSDYQYYPTDGFLRPRNFILSTQTNIGIAFGDWKKGSKPPFCEVLTCDEQIRGHFKIRLPDISMGLKNQKLRLAGAYERKLGKGPFSIEGELRGTYYHYNAFASTRSSVGAQVSLRAYFLQNLLIRKGWGGNNLSGPYAEFRNNYGFDFTSIRPNRYFGETKPVERTNSQTIATTLHLGYQQRMFGKFYIDTSIGYGSNWYSRSKDYSLFDLKLLPSLQTDLKIGFTF